MNSANKILSHCKSMIKTQSTLYAEFFNSFNNFDFNEKSELFIYALSRKSYKIAAMMFSKENDFFKLTEEYSTVFKGLGRDIKSPDFVKLMLVLPNNNLNEDEIVAYMELLNYGLQRTSLNSSHMDLLFLEKNSLLTFNFINIVQEKKIYPENFSFSSFSNMASHAFINKTTIENIFLRAKETLEDIDGKQPSVYFSVFVYPYLYKLIEDNNINYSKDKKITDLLKFTELVYKKMKYEDNFIPWNKQKDEVKKDLKAILFAGDELNISLSNIKEHLMSHGKSESRVSKFFQDCFPIELEQEKLFVKNHHASKNKVL